MVSRDRGTVNQLVLWFDIVSFAIMAASAGLTYVVYTRNRAAWLRAYLVYAVGYGFWILFAGWAFFQQVYLSGPIPELVLAFAWVRVAVSVVIAYFGPLFFLRAAGIRNERRLRLGAWIAVIVLSVLMLLVMIYTITPLARAVSIAFNAAFAVLSWYAWARVQRARANPARPLLPVIAFSALAYTVLTILSSAGIWIIPPDRAIYANVLAGAAFVSGWALIGMVASVRWIGGGASDEAVPEAFITDFGITAREADIVRVLVTGKTAGQIGEELFISQRTVEAHLYNVYRKCHVKNRVELVNRIATYRG